MSLNADERLNLFVAQVCRHGSVWALMEGEEWWLLQSEGETSLPVWGDEATASAWANSFAATAQASSITLDAWLERWTPGLAGEEITVAVCPVATGDTVVLDAEALSVMLRGEQADG